MSYTKVKGQFGGKIGGLYRTRLLSGVIPISTERMRDEPKSTDARQNFCACGCGSKTSPILSGDSINGFVISGYRKFLHTHNWILHRKSKPEGWKSSHQIRLDALKKRQELCQKSIGLKSFQELRSKHPEAVQFNGRILTNASITRMMNKERKWVAFNVSILKTFYIRKPNVPEITDHYPYFRGDNLLDQIHGLLPQFLSREVRSEVCQEMCLAVLSGQIQIEQAKHHAPDFIKTYYRKFGRWDMTSLDALVGTSDRTSHEILLATPQAEMFAFNKTPDKILMRKKISKKSKS